MKRIISIISIFALCCVISNKPAFSFVCVDDDEEHIPIGDLEVESSIFEQQRTIKYIECSICHITNNVELNFSGIGDVDIYIQDASGSVVVHRQCSEMIGCITIPIPVVTSNGVYRIYIESDTYSGEGYFTIYN